MTKLLVEVPGLEKKAGERLPDNPQAWPASVVTHLDATAPYVLEGNDYQPDLQAHDAERGLGYGMVIITNQPMPKRTGPVTSGAAARSKTPETGVEARRVAIPFMIRDWELADMDLMVTDKGQWMPLTERRFDEVMFRSNPFVGTEEATPSGLLRRSTQPPGELSVGYGAGLYGGGQDRYASMDARALLKRVMHMTGSYGSIARRRPGLHDDVHFDTEEEASSRRTLARHPTSGDDLIDTAHSILPMNVLRIRQTASGDYEVTEISDTAYLPRRRILNTMELIAQYGKRVDNLLDVLASKSQDIVVTIDHQERDPLILEDYNVDPVMLETTGEVMVATEAGEFRQGRLFADVMTFEGHHLPYRLFTDGQCFAMQARIAGQQMGTMPRVVGSIPNDGEWGCYVHQDDDGHVEATVPFKVIAHHMEDGLSRMVVSTLMSGFPIVLQSERGIGRIYNPMGMTNAVAQYMATTFKIPADYTYVRCGYLSPLVEAPDLVNNAVQRHLKSRLQFHEGVGFPELHDRGNPWVTVYQFTDDTYGIQGKTLESLHGRDNETGLGRKDALFRLVVLGLSVEGAGHVLDRVDQQKRVTVGNLRKVDSLLSKTADLMGVRHDLEKVCGGLRRDLHKEAEQLGEEQGLDALLSLGYITPETIEEFVQQLPVLQQAESGLAQLLFMTRMGFESVEEQAVERSLRNLNEVNEQLEFLRDYSRDQRANEQRRAKPEKRKKRL